jgi:hypothetical protein
MGATGVGRVGGVRLGLRGRLGWCGMWVNADSEGVSRSDTSTRLVRCDDTIIIFIV